MNNSNQFDKLDLPISFGVKNELLHAKIKGEWVPLGTSGKDVEKLYHTNYGNIPAHKRDIAISKEEIQGQEAPYSVPYNYVSVFDRYIGWYKDNNAHRSYEPILSRNRFYTFSTGRIIDGTPIEQLTKEEITNAFSAKGDPVFWNMGSEGTYSSMHYKYTNAGKEYVSKTDIRAKKNIFEGIVHYPILATDLGALYNPSHITEEEDKPIQRDLVMLKIDWNTVPKDAYFRYSLCTEFGYTNSDFPTIQVKMFKLNYDGKSTKFETFSQFPESIKTITLNRKGNDIYYTDEYHYLDSDGDPHQNFIKLERPEERYTILALEVHYPGTLSSGFNVRNGIFINMFVPEEQFHNTCRGYNETNFLYIKDFSKVGKIWNMNNYSLSDYAALPTFPKLGDKLTVLKGVDAVGNNIAPVYDEYICLGPILGSRSTNPSSNYLYKTGRYAATYPKKVNLEILEYDNVEIRDDNPYEYYKQWIKVGSSPSSSSSSSSSNSDDTPITIPFRFEYDPNTFVLETSRDLVANPLTIKEFTELEPIRILQEFKPKLGNVIDSIILYGKCKGTEEYARIKHDTSYILSTNDIKKLLSNKEDVINQHFLNYSSTNIHSLAYTEYKLKINTALKKYNIPYITYVKLYGNFDFYYTIAGSSTNFKIISRHTTGDYLAYTHDTSNAWTKDRILAEKLYILPVEDTYIDINSTNENLQTFPNEATKCIIIKQEKGINTPMNSLPYEDYSELAYNIKPNIYTYMVEEKQSDIPWILVFISKSDYDTYYSHFNIDDVKFDLLSKVAYTNVSIGPNNNAGGSLSITMRHPESNYDASISVYTTLNSSFSTIEGYDRTYTFTPGFGYGGNSDLNSFYMIAYTPISSSSLLSSMSYTDISGKQNWQGFSIQNIDTLALKCTDFKLITVENIYSDFAVTLSDLY